MAEPFLNETGLTEVICTVISTCGFYYFFRKHEREKLRVQNMQMAPEISYESIFTCTGKAKNPVLSGFVAGSVFPVQGSGFLSVLSPTSAAPVLRDGKSTVSGVVLQKTITQLVTAKLLGFWSTNEKLVSVEQQAVPFNIVQDNLKVQIHNPFELESIPLQVVDESFETPDEGFLSFLLSCLHGVRTTGIKHTQEMLVTGTEVVGIGRLVHKASGVYLESDPNLPYLISCSSREGIINSFARWLPFYKVGTTVCLFISCCLFFRFTYRKVRSMWLNTWRSYTARARLRAIAAAQEYSNRELPAQLSCIACYGLRNAAILPCAHVASCLKCVEKMYLCPVCRGEIISVQPLIYS